MSSAAKVGVFMLIILGILGYFILKIEDIDITRGKGTYKAKAAFANVAGLDEKSVVRVSGVRKGKVAKVEFINGKAEVTLEVDKDVPLYKNASARVANIGLLGEKYIELEPGSPDTPRLSPQETMTRPLRGTSPASIDEVTSQISAIATDVKAVTESLRHVMGGPAGQQRLEDIVDNVRLITDEVRQLIAANRANVDATVGNMRTITADLRVEIPKLAASLDRVANQIGGTIGENREDLHRVVENLRTLSADLRTTTENLNDITGQVKSGQGTVGKLIYSPEAHDRLTAALASVDTGVTELRTTLGRLNRVGLDLGLKADYMGGLNKEHNGVKNLGGNSRSAVTLRLVPNVAKNRFYSVELADDPRGRKREKDTILTVTNPATGVSTTTLTHETRFDRDFRISAQAGWLLENLGVRVGLIDNTGGVGADYQWNHRIRFTGEAFDFGQRYDNNPHFRAYGEYTLRLEKPRTPRIFVSAGVDNPLNDVAFTFGGGIRWRDDDLKYLLGSIPVGR